MFYKATISELKRGDSFLLFIEDDHRQFQKTSISLFMMNHELHAVILDLDHDEDLNAVFRHILYICCILHVVLN